MPPERERQVPPLQPMCFGRLGLLACRSRIRDPSKLFEWDFRLNTAQRLGVPGVLKTKLSCLGEAERAR
jgi:hypothetical protein